MTVHQVLAVFTTQAEAERIARVLVSELNIPHAAVMVSPIGHEPPVGRDTSDLWAASVTGPTYSLFMTEESRRAHLEALRSGRIQLLASVEERDIARATLLLEQSGALALHHDGHELKREPDSHLSASDATSPPSTTVAGKVVTTEAARRGHSRVRSYPAG